MIIPLLALTQVMYSEAWTGGGLATDINKKIQTLDATIDHDTQTLLIKDVKMSPECGYAFILYEIADKASNP